MIFNLLNNNCRFKAKACNCVSQKHAHVIRTCHGARLYLPFLFFFGIIISIDLYFYIF